MAEQLIQNDLYSENVVFGDGKYICLSLGSETVSSLIKQKKINAIITSKESKRKKPDVLIINKNKDVIIYQELKQPTKFKSEKDIEKAIKQEIDVARELKAKIYIVHDGETFIWVNPLTGNRIKDIEGNYITMPCTPKDEANSKALCKLIQDVSDSLNSENDQLIKKEYIDPTDLARKINGVLKNLTFASSKMALYTFVEVFLFKYLSDIDILTGENSFEYIWNLYNNVPEEKISDANILGKYTDGAREQMKYLFPNGDDGTTIINGQIFHVEKQGANYISPDNTDFVFKQVIKEFKKYEIQHGKFKYISKDFKSKLFETFMKNSDDKSDMGQFFTPLKIVDNMVKMVDVKEGMSICDPACGVGKFLLEAIENYIDEFYVIKHNDIQKKITLVGFEKMMSDGDDITVILAKANMLIYFSRLFQENSERISELTNSIINQTFTVHKTMLGTLENIHYNSYDLILANPPYYQSASMSEAAKNTGEYKLGGLGVEALFVEWIVKSLKFGGCANIVLPDGIFSNLANKKLKKYITDNCFIESIISLPVNAFFNTPKKTYIFTIRKKTEYELNNNVAQKYPVFTYICRTIGEQLDVNRFDTPDEDDLSLAVEKYNLFKKLTDEEKQKLKEPFKTYIGEDKLFKAIPISDFSNSKSWIIENWWSESEKIDIGLIKRIDKKTVDDFKTLIDETINLMSSFKEELDCLK